MSVIVVGASHRTADLSQLERLAVPGDDVPKALVQLVELPHVAEAVLLSTCNRVEVYASVARFHAGLDEVRGWLAARAGLDPDGLDAITFTHFDAPAVQHLFRVASGADSMIVGEQQIAVQLKDAMEGARLEGTARTVLQRVFRQAVRVGRRVRRETEITSGARSMVDIGLERTIELLGGTLDGRDVLIVGAGKVGSLAAAAIGDRASGRCLVWNRSQDKAERLAARVGGEVVDTLAAAMAEVDIVICTTGAGGFVVDTEMVAGAMRQRSDRRMVLIDLAMPRNVEPSADDVPGVDVIDLADIRSVSDRSITGSVLADAERIVLSEAADFATWLKAREVDPVIAALRGRAEAVRAAEVDRLASKLSSLDDKQRANVEALTRGIINTLLHEPTVRLKQLAESQAAEHAVGALRDLFDLDDRVETGAERAARLGDVADAPDEVVDLPTATTE